MLGYVRAFLDMLSNSATRNSFKVTVSKSPNHDFGQQTVKRFRKTLPKRFGHSLVFFKDNLYSKALILFVIKVYNSYNFIF